MSKEKSKKGSFSFALRSAMVFFLKKEINEKVRKLLIGFAAGVMIYVVMEELVPDANEGPHSNLATIGLAVGFALMMVLDIALG